jgi:imidazolonepropionase-like amidohydrolase
LAYEPGALGVSSWRDTQANIEKIKQSRIAANNAYWFFDSLSEVDAKWEKFLAGNPDIVKIFLLDAANQSKLKLGDNIGGKGLLPEVAEYIVKRAHAANRRVYAHIETADDFRLGLKIGVDGFAHLPGYGWDGSADGAGRIELTAADFKLAAEKRVVVIPSLNIGKNRGGNWDNKTGVLTPDPTRTRNILARQKRMLELMRQAGVRIALGSDSFGNTLDGELRRIYENKMLDNLTLLKIAVETTTQTIFPNRKIGRLREGYEASFLVLNGNPIENFERVNDIRLRFKQGFLINAVRCSSEQGGR